jgi:polysaccharide biosynthesis transport protein
VERDDVISLQDYLAVLRRQRWIVGAVTAIVVVAALAVSFAQTPVYEADAEVVVDPVRRSQDVSIEELLAPTENVVQTERLVVTSRPVAERVGEEVGMSPSDALERIRVEAVADTRVMRIVADSTDPAAAADIANAFAAGYLDYRRDQALDEVLTARESLEERAAELREQIDELDEDDEAEAAQRDALLAQLSQLSNQAAELGDGAAGSITGGGSVLTPAELPEGPVSPRPLRTGALALVLGALLGVGVAFLRDHIDDVVRDESDFKRAIGGRPILGRIPSWSDPAGGDRLATVVEPASIASEAYRELSAGVRFMLVAHEQAEADGSRHHKTDDAPALGRSILMASASAGDGKTSTAANLAVAAARVGLRTLLVDTDLRRSTVNQRFGLGKTTGLSDLLLNGDELHEHVVSVGVENLRVLPAGTIPPNPHELLASPAMRGLEREILERVDLVIYDTPAVLAVPDALELARHADVTVLVGRAGETSRRQLSAAVERFATVGTDVTGGVLNGLSGKADGYYYAYYYADEAEQQAQAEAGKRAKKDRPARERARPARPGRGRRVPVGERKPIETEDDTTTVGTSDLEDTGEVPAQPVWQSSDTSAARPVPTNSGQEDAELLFRER